MKQRAYEMNDIRIVRLPEIAFSRVNPRNGHCICEFLKMKHRELAGQLRAHVDGAPDLTWADLCTEDDAPCNR